MAPRTDDQRGDPTQRDRAVTALVLGFFAAAWFGWGQAESSQSVVLGVGSALGLAASVAGGVLAYRYRATGSVLGNHAARRRYGLIVGVEFALAGLGAAALGLTGHAELTPVWVCAVVGVHLLPLASVLRDATLRPLGVAITLVAVTALVLQRTNDVAASTTTGLGAGTLLLAYAALSLTRAARST